jgi:hypothetical protein
VVVVVVVFVVVVAGSVRAFFNASAAVGAAAHARFPLCRK